MQSVSAIGLKRIINGERISPCFSAYLHSRFHHKIASANTESEPENDDKISAMKLYYHADSPVFRRYSSVLDDKGSKAAVTGVNSELVEPMKVPVVTAAVAYGCEYTGKTFILVIYNTLYLRNMEMNLVPPIMMRLPDLDVY